MKRRTHYFWPLVHAQNNYTNQQTSEVTIPTSGVAHVNNAYTVGGVSVDVAGTPGAAFSVSTATYSQNPQASATIPLNTVLTHFVVVSFNVAEEDLHGANITISYTDSDVSGMDAPYQLYKFVPETNSFIQLATVVDSNARTLTVTLHSTTDPLFAIGGTKSSTSAGGVPSWAWVIIVVVAVVAVLVSVLILRRRHKPTYKLFV